MDNPSPAAARRRLPIGIQTLRQIREQDRYYVDKTGLAVDLAEAPGKAFFLSRPRRFGKSLFVDTLQELFESNRALFTGLAAESRWDWSRRHPVIRISFGGGLSSSERLEQRIAEILDDNAQRLGVRCHHHSIAGRFGELIRRAHEQHGERVVVLVDEYDKPILDALDDPPLARTLRQGLKALYETLKDADAHLRLAFFTGVSRFTKVSLFSGLNQMVDLTLEPAWSALCGYTDDDIDTVFAPELPGLDRDEIRRWYNGYNWRGTSVYNPFDVLLLFQHREFRPWWFETGTPTFLVDLLTTRHVHTPDLDRLFASTQLLSTFDIDTIPTEALLFQTGYLTIAGERRRPGRIDLQLRYPNQEVQASLNEVLLQRLSGDLSAPGVQISRLWDVLAAGDVAALQPLFRAFFASIPNDWYRNSPIARFEGYWASIFYSHFAALGLDIRVEDTTHRGRIDMVVLACAAVWIFEFKVIDPGTPGRALQQIRDRGYADKYRDRGEPIHLIGVEFSAAERTLVTFEAETVPPPACAPAPAPDRRSGHPATPAPGTAAR